MPDIQSSIQALAETFKSTSLSAKSVLGGSIEDLKNSLDSSSKQFAASGLVENANLGSTKIDVTAAKKVADENFKKLANSLSGTTSASAIKAPVSFVTSTSQQAIEPSGLASIASQLDLSKFTSSELTKLKDMTGLTELTSESVISSLTSKIGSIQGDFAKNSSLLTDQMQAGDPGALMGLPSDMLNTPITPDINSLPSTAKNYLPPEIKSAIGYIGNRTTSQLDGKISTITNKLSSVANIGKSLGSILGLGGTYPEATDANGNPIPGLAGNDMGYGQITSLYRDARNICTNIDLLNLLEYGNLKDVYDVLVNAALNGGLANLVKQLMNCTAFVDDRTGYIMQQNVANTSYRGDIFTLNAIQDQVGVSGIKSPLKTARTVAANMDYDSNSANEYDSFLASHSLTRNDLVKDDIGPDGTISTQMVGFLSAKDTKLVDTILSKDTRNTALTFLSSFS